MADKGYHSLETLLAEILRREQNVLEFLEMMRNLTVATTDKINIEYTLEDGSQQTIETLSYGYLLKEIQRVSTDLDNISGINTTSVNLKLPDGTTRTLMSTDIPHEPNPVTGLSVPGRFEFKTNDVVNKLVDPQTYLTVDLTGKINPSVKKVLVKRIEIDVQETEDLEYFNSDIKGQNNLSYDAITKELSDRNIGYTESDDIVNLNLKRSNFVGTFGVTKVTNTTENTILDGQLNPVDKLVFKLDRTSYKDIDTDTDISLKVGDMLAINYTDSIRTSYKIESIDLSTNEVKLNRMEGYDPIKVGTDILRIYPNIDETTNLDLSVTRTEYLAYWFKPVEPVKSLVSNDWGFGMGLYTDELVNTSEQLNLLEFTDQKVNNLSKNLIALANDSIISAVDGLTPDAPVITTDNFSVDIVNTHKNNIKNDEEVKKKTSEKNRLESRLQKLAVTIEKTKEDISSANFKTRQEEITARNGLSKKQTERANLSRQIRSLVDEIVTLGRQAESFKPKYRVRGFFEIPETKYKDEINKLDPQEVVQFEIQYRYLRKDNTSTEADTKKFLDKDGNETKATQAKWISVLSDTRKRVLQPDGTLQFPSTDDLSDPDVVNINQLEIPISSGENVEIRIKSVSEAGYPSNPLKSEWSESVIVEFPEEEETTTDSLRTEAEDERVKSVFEQELEDQGLLQHVQDSETVNETYFAHGMEKIRSPFRTPENKPIPGDEAMVDLQNQISALKAIIDQERGSIDVKITDELGGFVDSVSNNKTVKIFGGYYTELVQSASIPKGEIITKSYNIEISNLSQADLELLSFVPGLESEAVPDENYDGYLHNTNEYTQYRKYWEVPMSIRSATNGSDLIDHYDDENGSPFISIPPYQSFQNKGQVAYARKRDISLNNKLYDKPASQADEVFMPIFTGSDTRSYVWDGSLTTGSANGGGSITDFSVHTSHPDLSSDSELMENFGVLFGGTSNPLPISARYDANTKISFPQFSHSAYFNLESGESNGKIQLQNVPFTEHSGGGVPSLDNFPRKVGFSKNDKYLIGKNTCGSYLFLAPDTANSISTESAIFNVGRVVKFGDSFKVIIPFIFQFRMTDYDGAGDTGTGIIGGYGKDATNLEYTKKIGFDIVIKDQNVFSFDIECKALYKPTSVSEV